MWQLKGDDFKYKFELNLYSNSFKYKSLFIVMKNK